MDENQKQDWWPTDNPAGVSQTPEENTQPGSSETTSSWTEPAPQAEIPNEPKTGSETYRDPWNQNQDSAQQPNQNPYQNSTDQWNQNPNQNSANQWSQNPYQNSADQWSQNPYQNSADQWNQNPNQNSANPWNQNPYQNPGYQPRKPMLNAMSVAALVMGILSVLLICCGFSFFFGALGILFAILSRKTEPLDPQAKIGLGLSIAGTTIGLLILVYAFSGYSSYSEDFLEEYKEFYNEYEDNTLEPFQENDWNTF